MSYGNMYIQSDLERGKNIKQIASIVSRYNKIPLYRAEKLVKFQKKYGVDKFNPLVYV